MVAIDTNVLVRLLVNDDPSQHRASRRLFAAQGIYIADTVLLETEWVLRHAFEFSPQDICAALRRTCGLPNVSLADPELVARTLDWHEAGLDFADAMHLATSGQRVFKTFDRELIEKAVKVADRPVEEV